MQKYKNVIITTIGICLSIMLLQGNNYNQTSETDKKKMAILLG